MRDTETDDADVIDDEPILLHMPCEHCSERAGRAVQDDGLDVDRLRDAIGSVFGYLARPDADKVAAAYRASPLNASESPPTLRYVEDAGDGHGALVMQPWDASESGQPPEASDE